MLYGAGLVIDRLIGAWRVPKFERQSLAVAQARSTVSMAPVMLFGSNAIALGIATASLGTPNSWWLAAWAVAIAVVEAMEFTRLRKQSAVSLAPGETVLASFVRGALWGGLLLLVPSDNPELHTILVVAVGGIACCVVASSINYPHALFAAMSSFVPLTGIALLTWGEGGVPAGGLVLLICSSAAALATLGQARLFVERWIQQSRLSSDEKLIGLLLKDRDAASYDWLWAVDQDGLINRTSAGLSAATQLGSEQLLRIDFVEFLSNITGSDDLMMLELREAIMRHQPFFNIELRLSKVGSDVWWRLSGEPVFSESGAFAGYVGTGSDISECRRSERRILALAHNDPLTGLHNRTKFTEALNHCVARLERYGTPFALISLDLDDFKLVNDNRGHLCGDKLLVEVGKRINACIRETDFSARLGGDEFAVLVSEGASEEGCAQLAERLISTISQSITVDGEDVDVGASVGVAIAPLHGTRPDQIQRNADLALYRAKQDGRSVYRFFENKMDADARERRLLETELRDALRKGELTLFYQPLISAVDRRPTGFEALMRWRHPLRGVLAPAEFISIAEQSNLIAELGDWSINEACKAAMEWPEHLTVAVNLSAKHFRLSDIVEVVGRALETSGLPPSRLELEITEGLLLVNADEVTDKLSKLQAIGVTIAMDDFGTGYSSLSYLLKFPFDKIKIDRSFVDASSTDPMARDILKAIASLGKTLRLRITAEGVETPAQANFLSEIACHQLQGYYFARPIDLSDMPAYLLTDAGQDELLPVPWTRS